MNGCDCDSTKERLLSYEEAISQLLTSAQPLPDNDKVKTEDALGRVLAVTLSSAQDVPPLDNSAMDGYAVASQDVSFAGTCLPVSQRICAGDMGHPLTPGTAARIFTGAPIPQNADAVIMQEQCERSKDQVTFMLPASAGQNIRRAGEDISTGDEILQQGVCLRAQELGLAASIGLSELPVHRRVKAGLFFTGDELVEPGKKLEPGQIYDSNRFTLLGLLQTLGCEVVDLGVVADNLPSTKQAIMQATERADVVITSGGVSVGEEDHVRIALEQLGKLQFWRIAMKPGKPVAFGQVNGTPFFGLPGNPVSVFVTFCLFASPFIKKMQGRARLQARAITVKANFNRSAGTRREYLRAQLLDDNGQCCANIYPHQGSGVLTSTSWADGLVVTPIGKKIQQGDRVEYLPFTELL